MKPNFALSLSFDGIKLLHRAAGGWREVGEVAVTSDDLGGELAVLRKTASSLEPGGVRTKLLIPSSQIKYLTIDTIGLSEAACRKAAEEALHDATPYEVHELAYDISLDGPRTHVAAVARETLAEAEAFATEHRFHPVSFVAVPDDAPYLGEPFFGPTQGAADLLEPGEVVEPDGIAVVIVGAIPAPQPEYEPEIAVEAEEEALPPAEDTIPAAVVVEPEIEPEPEFEPQPAPKTEPVATAPVEHPDEPKSEPAAEPKPADVTQGEPQDAQLPFDLQIDPTPAAEPVHLSAPPAKPVTAPATDAPKIAEAAPAPPIAEPPLNDEATTVIPAAESRPADEPLSAATATDTPKAAPDTPAAPPTEDIPNPARARALAAAAAVVEPAKTMFTTSQKPPQPAPQAPVVDTSASEKSVPPSGFASRRAAAPAPAKPLGGAARGPVVAPLTPDSSSLDQPAAVADTPAPAKTGFLSRRKPRTGAAAPMPAPVAQVAAAGSEAERMTVFGARADTIGGKPRFLGLIMTVILLVFLAGVAAWAAVFLDEGIAGLMKKDESRATASAPENQIDPEIIRTPDGVETAQEETDEAVQVAALDPVLSAEDTAVLDALQDTRPEPERPVITEQEAAARYAVTGIWPLAPDTPLTEGAVTSDPVYFSGIDTIGTSTDAIALPAPRGFETDTRLAAVASPPPFGQRTDIDENGLIVPTENGVVTATGFTVFAGSPPLKPPAATLARFTAPQVTAPPVPTSPLLGFRPKNRPIGLAERSERAQLGGVSRSELAAYRPALRPRSIQERARAAEDEAKNKAAQEQETQEARAAAAAQAATAAAAAALAIPQPTVTETPAAIQNATRFATAKSIRPDTRPRNFARIVKRAERAAPKETRVAAAATVAPRTVSPKLPSKASVARSATVKNAINLRKVNLIGVYGKPSSRRALVRLSNGRYQKVRVGDRIDGGRVSAISNSELRYAKGGRNVVLKMP
ncbi:hypothetical protein [uncultured Sulfitobacter sp.]|uniref:hypothetical protein n=1 Tax=uncultured Sulfitobacter sp. TaxID=191468 RepID=UPI00262D03AB|nr:hypothetical protein [uncultured Sulfitobacter sp.]